METSGILRFISVISILLCATGLGSAREVRVQEGPLYRVVDNPISIRCNVSEYEGPPTQNFEWFMYRPSAPDISISIVSTKDPEFAYAVFSGRVRKGDIFIQRLSGDSTELHIKQLRAEDEGVYECYTPTTDSRYLGSYSGNGPRLSTSSPLQLNLVQGRELHLSCSASADSTQHTHLSVTFGVSDPGAPVGRGTLRNIISLGRDFTVEPSKEHQTYGERYLNGELRLEKTDNSTYKMVITRVRPQDTGSYHCTAAQWIQDPDGSWQKVTEKRSVLAQLTVQSVGRDGHEEPKIQAGGMVDLFCNVSAAVALPPDMALSMEWWVTSSQQSPGQLVASMSTDGSVSLGERYTEGDTGTRHISLEKLSPSPGSFRLRIYSAQPGDIGAYSCRVKAFVSYPGQRLEEVSSRVSQSINVLMTVQDISLSVHVHLDSIMLYRGNTASLLCNITVETPQTVHMAVSWWVELAGEKPNERMGRLLASVNRQGVSEPGMRISGQDLSTDKVGAQCYRLRLYNIQAEDEGLYHCAVTAWIQYPDLTWYNAASAKSNNIKMFPYAQVKDLLFIPMIGGVASALFVGITILATVTCCYIRQLRVRKR
ncbi:PREDICTED: LOW QUALITY PROTEIN: immunoglobulin superfamily member 8 [Nanorana parkeri]|uniref:LOW QUALITY PROTEIN: immunoglobulin superfamily member 8 n=1 Tax=Nanorana parkeri TaxID=125878 RepID=UPI000854F099|nr:PREDICTED: LOW QUALITY PROTEIN: immunoglobulin superfamily member 8 [Nanorana parkeri]